MAYLSQKLARIVTDAPITLSIEDCVAQDFDAAGRAGTVPRDGIPLPDQFAHGRRRCLRDRRAGGRGSARRRAGDRR